MTVTEQASRTAQIDRLAEEARKRRPADPDNVERFIHEYFALVAPDDLRTDSETLLGGALSLWDFGEERAPGQSKIRIFNATPAESGWSLSHTVIEVVNDDMPFLVDSIVSELNRVERNIHLIIHPVVSVRRDKGGKRTAIVPRGRSGREESSHRVVHAFRDRPGDRRSGSRGAPEGPRADPRGRPPRGFGLAGDARPSLRGARRDRPVEHADPGGRGRGVEGVPPVADRRELHLPRIPPVPVRARGRQGVPQDRPGIRPRNPARRPSGVAAAQRRSVHAGVQPFRPEKRAHRRREGESPRDGAPRGPHGPDRDQAIRHGREPGRRRSFPRPVHIGRVRAQHPSGPAAPAEGDPASSSAPASRGPATPARS